MKSKKGLLIGLGIVVLLVGFFITTSNKLVRSESNVDEAYANVDTQLQRRNDLIPNLVSTTKGYAEHESKIFTDIAAARSNMIAASKSEDMTKISEANSNMDNALGRLLALQENYPDLKADKQFTQLSDELAGTENRIAVARKDYNQEVKSYNNTIGVFPTSLVASMKGLEKKPYFKATESAQSVPTVDFNTSSSTK
jgi:Uncharacterized conserved protein